MITLDADIHSSAPEGLSLPHGHAISLNEELHHIDEIDIVAIEEPPIEEILKSEIFANESSIQAPVPIREWAPYLESEFQNLAEKEALDEATTEEMQHLEELSLIRARFNANMSAEQIFFLHNLQKKQDRLLNELSEYVSFVKASHC